MKAQLYSVTLVDNGTYQVNVVAANVKDAESIAKAVLVEEAGCRAHGLTVTNRAMLAEATLAERQPSGMYRVEGVYELDFALDVPAETKAEAELYARRLYDQNPGPFEFDIVEDRVRSFVAREVRS